jgi:hypothetical protein
MTSGGSGTPRFSSIAPIAREWSPGEDTRGTDLGNPEPTEPRPERLRRLIPKKLPSGRPGLVFPASGALTAIDDRRGVTPSSPR